MKSFLVAASMLLAVFASAQPTVYVGKFVGDGTGLTNTPGGSATANTIQTNASGTVPAAVALTNAANSFTGNGSGLSSLNASALASGTVPSSVLSGNNITNAQGFFYPPSSGSFVNGTANNTSQTNMTMYGSTFFGTLSGYPSNSSAQFYDLYGNRGLFYNGTNSTLSWGTNNVTSINGSGVISNIMLSVPTGAQVGWVWVLTNTATGQGTWTNSIGATNVVTQITAGTSVTVTAVTNASGINYTVNSSGGGGATQSTNVFGSVILGGNGAGYTIVNTTNVFQDGDYAPQQTFPLSQEGLAVRVTQSAVTVVAGTLTARYCPTTVGAGTNLVATLLTNTAANYATLVPACFITLQPSWGNGGIGVFNTNIGLNCVLVSNTAWCFGIATSQGSVAGAYATATFYKSP